MMGGKIWVESEIGRGSMFHFTVLMKKSSATAIKVGQAAPPELLRDVKVLVVDDNRTNRRILNGMLTRWEMKPSLSRKRRRGAGGIGKREGDRRSLPAGCDGHAHAVHGRIYDGGAHPAESGGGATDDYDADVGWSPRRVNALQGPRHFGIPAGSRSAELGVARSNHARVLGSH